MSISFLNTYSFNFPDASPGTTITAGCKNSTDKYCHIIIRNIFVCKIYVKKYDNNILDGTHLANQHYKVCFRRGNGKEVICYIPCTSIVGSSGDVAAIAVSPTAQVRF